MKGIVFSEYLNYLEKEHGYKLVDEVILSSNLESDGVYTSVGFYPFEELVELLVQTSKKVDKSIPTLMHDFGYYLLSVFLTNHAKYFTQSISAFDILEKLDSAIHPEVQKLYPDAELPRFNLISKDDSQITLEYYSKRKMSEFAFGLIHACLDHYNESADISVIHQEKDGEIVRFKVQK